MSALPGNVLPSEQQDAEPNLLPPMKRSWSEHGIISAAGGAESRALWVYR